MESTPEQQAEGQAIVKVLAAVLERLVCANTSLARTDPGQVTKFHALKSPGIGVLPYLERIHKYASCSNECFILALIYIDRLIQRNNFLLTELNVHRVVITAILLAAKFFDDAYYNNAYYSKVGGVLVSEMNGLEVDFLFRINFSLHVTPEVFEKYKAELVAHSVSTGHTMHQTPTHPPVPDMSSEHSAPLSQTQPIPIEQPQQHQPMATHYHPSAPHVTPSPHHVGSFKVSSAALLAPPSEPVSGPHNPMPLYAPDNGISRSVADQFVRRANSLPPAFPSHTGRCADSHPANNSAPMVSMMPVEAEQYIMMNNQIFPLQTTLVHHHHGVDSYHEQPNFHQQHGNGYAAIAGQY